MAIFIIVLAAYALIGTTICAAVYFALFRASRIIRVAFVSILAGALLAWPYYELSIGKELIQPLCEKDAGTLVFGRASKVEGFLIRNTDHCHKCADYLYWSGYRFVEYEVGDNSKAKLHWPFKDYGPGTYRAYLSKIEDNCQPDLSERERSNVSATKMCMVYSQTFAPKSKFEIYTIRKPIDHLVGRLTQIKTFYKDVSADKILMVQTSYTWLPTGPLGRHLAGDVSSPWSHRCSANKPGIFEGVTTVFQPIDEPLRGPVR